MQLSQTDQIYHDLVKDVLENGALKGDRTGTGTRAVVGRMAHYNILNGRSPRPTTKGMSDTPEREMLWFRDGSSSIRALRDQGIGIWNSWLMPGTAVYRKMKQAEVESAIIKALTKKHGCSTAKFIHAPTWDAFDFAEDQERDIGGAVTCTSVIYGDLDGLHEYFIKIHAGDPRVLIDGDIGAGGYGPQWRKWQDTQFVSRAELPMYLNEGYKVKGKIVPDIEPFGVEEIKKSLHDFLIADGHPDTSIGDADPAMLPECGWEAVGGPGQVVHVLYLDEAALIRAYAEILDIPRFVVHREIDQLANAVNLLKENPDSRRIIVSAWNPALIWKAALPPCHLYFQFISHELTVMQRVAIFNDKTRLTVDYEKRHGGVDWANAVELDGFEWEELCANNDDHEALHKRLDFWGVKRRALFCFVLLRSNDLGLGQPFNVAQYATLTHMVAKVVKMEPVEVVWAAVDAHIYANHVEALEHQLTLESKECTPRLVISDREITDIDGFTIDDLKIVDYEAHPALTSKMPVAV